MKSNRTKIALRGTIAVLSLILGIGAVSLQTAQAQDRNYPYGQDRDNRDGNRRGRNWDNYGNYGGSVQLRQTALNAGYNEGLREGTAARSRNRNSDFASQNTYRKATRDYSPRLGDREIYRQYFREAYQNGFNDGFNPQAFGNNRDRDWNRNDNRRSDNRDWNRRNREGDQFNWGGSENLRQTALNAGYHEGIKQGRNNRNRNVNYDFRSNSGYQKATTDYSSKLGDRSLYQRYYRAGFENGYNDGLNGN